MNRCEQTEDVLVAWVRQELSPLKHEHVASHLADCNACRTQAERLRAGLNAAHHWEPTVDPDALARLNARLAPYTGSRQRRRGWHLVALTAGITASVTGAWLALRSSPPPPLPVEAAPVAVAPMPVPASPLTQHALAPYLRLIAGDAWDGVTERDGDIHTVRLTRGFVAIAFAGGPGRRLQVQTPGAWVEVVGTRFFVEVAGPRTAVGVVEGTVKVLTLGGAHPVTAGQTRVFEADGTAQIARAPLSGPDHVNDSYLLSLPHPRPSAGPARGPDLDLTPTPKRRKPRRSPSDLTPPTDTPAPDVLGALEAAEQRARSGNPEAAVTAYEACAQAPHPAYDAFRDLCRFEAARLVAFALGRRAEGKQRLQQLAQSGHGEAQRQAILALCEWARAPNPCAALACLNEVSQTTSDVTLADEAQALRRRWHDALPTSVRCSGGDTTP